MRIKAVCVSLETNIFLIAMLDKRIKAQKILSRGATQEQEKNEIPSTQTHTLTHTHSHERTHREKHTEGQAVSECSSVLEERRVVAITITLVRLIKSLTSNHSTMIRPKK